MAHGAVLRSRFYSAEQVEAIVRDYHNAGLDPVDVAIMDLAHKVALHAYKVTLKDIEGLRQHGLTDYPRSPRLRGDRGVRGLAGRHRNTFEIDSTDRW